jgi:predicted DNA-binding transcriptional regulator AlpA
MSETNEILAPANSVEKRYQKCGRTIKRWLDDPELEFPKPIYIRRRRYWREADLINWERAQASKSRAA